MKGICARIWLQGRLQRGWLTWHRGRIQAVGQGDPPHSLRAQLEDLGSARILPGFVDTLVHGFAGVGTATCPARSLQRMSRALASAGVTTALAGFYPLPLPQLRAAARRWDNWKKLGGARTRFQGWHVEGVFVAPAMAGALPPAGLLAPSARAAQSFHRACGGWLRMSTLAPELPAALEAAECLRALGVQLSIGHSAATLKDCRRLASQGPVAITHLGNRVRPLTAREPGPIGFAMGGEADFVAVIPDATHVAADTLRLWTNTPALRHRLMAVSDNLAHAGLPADDFLGGGQRLHRDGSVARNAAGELGGTLDSLPELLFRRVEERTLTLAQAVRLGAETPGRLFGDCGRIEVGMRADLVEWQPPTAIGRVWVAGRPV